MIAEVNAAAKTSAATHTKIGFSSDENDMERIMTVAMYLAMSRNQSPSFSRMLILSMLQSYSFLMIYANGAIG